MATTTYFTLKCQCGRTGKIKLRKSDPKNSVSWCRYSLEELNGLSYYAENNFVNIKEVIPFLQATCPKCNRLLSAENLIEKKAE